MSEMELIEEMRWATKALVESLISSAVRVEVVRMSEVEIKDA